MNDKPTITVLKKLLRLTWLAVLLINVNRVWAADETDQTADPSNATGSISGRVVDAQGMPMRQAHVWLHKYHDQIHNYALACNKSPVDESGQYHFSGLTKGDYVVAATAGDLATSRFDVFLEKSQNQKFDITLHPAVQASVRFQDESGQPIVGVTLRTLTCRGDNGKLQFWSTVAAGLGMQSDPSDQEGLLQLPPLPEGTIITSAIFKHAKYAPVKIPETPLATGVIAAVTMKPGIPLSLRILPTKEGKTIGHAMLSVVHDDDENASTIYDSPIPIREDGTATITVEAGKYRRLSLQSDKYFITPQFANDLDPLEIGAGRNDQRTFELHPKVKVHGQVTDISSGLPLQETYVYAATPNGSPTDWTNVGGAESDAQGRYELEVPAGPVRLSVLCDNFTLGKSWLESQIPEDGLASLTDIQLHANPKITGRVVDPDGQPVPGAIVRLRGIFPFMRQAPAATDNDGRFKLPLKRIPEDFDNGSIELAWTSPLDVCDAFRPLSTRIEVHLDQPDSFSNITIKLQPESYQQFLERAQQPTSAWLRKAFARRQEAELAEPKLIGQDAPELVGATWFNTEKPSMSLAVFRGKYVLLVFWAVWCGPCHADFPDVKLLNETYKDHGLVIIGVHNNSVDAEAVHEHAQQQGLTFPIAVDRRDGQIVETYKKIGAVSGYPSYILIGPDGKIVETDRMALCKFDLVRKYLFSDEQP